jgi:ribosomal protein S18 acetylase RimI-like enzyme
MTTSIPAHAITITAARETHLPAILNLYAQLGQDDGRVLDLDTAQKLLARIASYPDYRLYVAVIEGKVIGCFALLIMDNLAHCGEPSAIVEDVVVAEQWRGRGIGQAMMGFATRISQRKGCYKIVLSSNRMRQAAHRFYERLGFSQHGYSFFLSLPAEQRVRQ